MVLTAQRLVQLSKFPHLSSSWYFIAASTLSVCNQPQEIPKLYHYALKLAQYDNKVPGNALELAQDAIKRNENLTKLSHDGLTHDPEFNTVENLNNLDPKANQDAQYTVSLKTREAILKSLALGGIPKAINTLMQLKNSTPIPLRSTTTSRDFSPSNTEHERQRGEEYWKKVYGKVSDRVSNQMNTAYPDLWEFTINHVYSPLLSFSEVLSPGESSLVITACLIPQDVNPQLKGHLKGALNNGCTVEELSSAREMSLLISQWCGIQWRDPVAKVKL
jgi:alkylhydroperoxidase/carboxymuconolactone decarboxylase family protein YurZ